MSTKIQKYKRITKQVRLDARLHQYVKVMSALEGKSIVRFIEEKILQSCGVNSVDELYQSNDFDITKVYEK